MEYLKSLKKKVIDIVVLLVLVSLSVSWVTYIGYLIMTWIPFLETLLWMFFLGVMFLFFSSLIFFIVFIIIMSLKEDA